MEIIVHRGPELWREPRKLAASTYGLARALQRRGATGVAFVPIRTLQMLAIIDASEFVFVDSHQRGRALLAWERLRPQARDCLQQAVEFDAVGYGELARQTMQRLPREFHDALCTLDRRQRDDRPARLLAFGPRPQRND